MLGINRTTIMAAAFFINGYTSHGNVYASHDNYFINNSSLRLPLNIWLVVQKEKKKKFLV
jgi:hypothetical protein